MLRTIQTVAVFRFGRRDEAPIVGISQPGDQRLASERTELGSIFSAQKLAAGTIVGGQD
jgi:hypothetical protein